jgi:hypothetical protein
MAQSQKTLKLEWIKREVLKEWDVWIKDNCAVGHEPTVADAFNFYELYLTAERRDLFSEGYLQGTPWRYVQQWLRECRNVIRDH